MSDLPLLSIVIFLPLFGVLAILLMRQANSDRYARIIGLNTSLITALAAVVAYVKFDPTQSGFQFVEKHMLSVVPHLTYHVGVDGLSLLLVMLSALLMPITLLAQWNLVHSRVRSYVNCFLILETFMIGSFCALDTILFYVFFEGVLIPMFLIIGIWGGTRRIYAATKFFLYTLLGSILMLVALMAMYSTARTTSIPELLTYTFDYQWQLWLWLAFFVSFAVKMPMWPVHTWLPDAHVEAPTAGSVILAGVLLKMGGYGFFRFSLPMLPEASTTLAPMIYTLSIVAVIYASLVALVQQDMKKLIAYSSVAHMAFVTFGAFSGSLQGMQGAFYQMLSHGIISAGLFLCVGVLYDRCHTRDISYYGGVAKQMPFYATLFMILIFGSVGLPATTGFVGEILVMISAFNVSGFMALFMVIGIVISAAYGLNLYRRVMFGKLESSELIKLTDLTGVEKIILIPLVILTIVFGIYPQPLLKITEPAITSVLRRYPPSLSPTQSNISSTAQPFVKLLKED